MGRTIYIRNVDAGVLAKIDELADQKGISRNKLVNIILENSVLSGKVKNIEDKYSGLVESNTRALVNLTQAIQALEYKITKENKK